MFKRIYLYEWQVIIFLAIFLAVIPNIAFWRNILILMPIEDFETLYFLLAMILLAICVLTSLLSLVLWQKTVKWLSLILLSSALCGYFSLNYNIYIDLNMLMNLLESNRGEAVALITPQLFIWLLCVFIVPAFVLFRVRIKTRRIGSSIKLRIIMVCGSLAILLMTSMPIYNYYASFFRNNNQIIKQLTPSNYIVASVKFLKKSLEKPLPYRAIGEDARQNKATMGVKPKLSILVVGETSRAQNFSLNGYKKQTNPKLSARENVFSFQNVSSCGTATAISVPCMFSFLTRNEYDDKVAKSQNNILDILDRAGVSVFWRENDEGCKTVCDNIPHENIIEITPLSMCKDNLCFDEYLLANLEDFVQKQKKDTLIILHSNGSHGPAYFERYPQTLENKFSPSCDTNQIQTCDPNHLMNTYDNTILYVDTVLDKSIDFLMEQNQFVTSLIYVSDHGESLGENGLFLHAAPYMIAPKEQTHVPFIYWFSDGWVDQEGLNTQCIKQNAQHDFFSHDNLFHTLLGIFDVQTTLYDPHLDMINKCKR